MGLKLAETDTKNLMIEFATLHEQVSTEIHLQTTTQHTYHNALRVYDIASNPDLPINDKFQLEALFNLVKTTRINTLDFPKVFELAQIGIEMAEQFNQPAFITRFQTQIGFINFEFAQYDLCLKICSHALDTIQKSPDMFNWVDEFEALIGIGLANWGMGNFEENLQVDAHAITLARKNNDTCRITRALYNHYFTLLHLPDHKPLALGVMAEAGSLADQLAPRRQRDILATYASALINNGDGGQDKEKALAIIENLMEEAPSDNADTEARVLLAGCNVRFEAISAESALEFFNNSTLLQVIQIPNKESSPIWPQWIQIQSHEFLHDVYMQLNDIQKAFDHYRQAHQLKIQSIQESSERQINNLKRLTELESATREKQLLTEQNELLEEQVKKRTLELAEALERATTLSHEKARLIDSISHTFRTPLTAINIATELLKLNIETASKTQQLDYLNRIEKGVSSLTEIIAAVDNENRNEKG